MKTPTHNEFDTQKTDQMRCFITVVFRILKLTREWLRNKGISYKSLEDSGIAFTHSKYEYNLKKPAFLMTLTVTTTFKSHSVKIEFDREHTTKKKVSY
jgi:acyl-CoA thioesterase FadM